MVKAPISAAVDSGLIPDPVKQMTLRLVFTASQLDSALRGQCGEQACKFTCFAVGKRHLAGFPKLRLVNRWLATSKRARYSALIGFS